MSPPDEAFLLISEMMAFSQWVVFLQGVGGLMRSWFIVSFYAATHYFRWTFVDGSIHIRLFGHSMSQDIQHSSANRDDYTEKMIKYGTLTF